MNQIAKYSLLTSRLDPERIDIICVGAILQINNTWEILIPGKEKLKTLGYESSADNLNEIATNFKKIIENFKDISSARNFLATYRSSLNIDAFEGFFTFQTKSDFDKQINIICEESINAPIHKEQSKYTRTKLAKPHIKTRLKNHFNQRGILAEKGDYSADHKVIQNYPLPDSHGLKTEFALKNSVWHITETIDFDVVDQNAKTKSYEAQAKCLILKTAQEVLGTKTARYIVINGGSASHAQNSIDLLSTSGKIFSVEESDDMDTYFEIISKAAGGMGQLHRYS